MCGCRDVTMTSYVSGSSMFGCHDVIMTSHISGFSLCHNDVTCFRILGSHHLVLITLYSQPFFFFNSNNIHLLQGFVSAGFGFIINPSSFPFSLSSFGSLSLFLSSLCLCVSLCLLQEQLWTRSPELDRDASAPEDLVDDRAARRAPSETVSLSCS